ncbi:MULTISPECIES: HalOD1 output domain-containing protein [Halomicrobium]|uniref:Halobacterial output domain-containing protein n=2 Tax=Halomicrobium mukohataei TaxID=57705 RepID=C7NY16_HALMD|nr:MULTISPECIES: HalOD1 output domain-containing protein [Halomicrobium]ACV48476.1 conserved hypothetical protein [Halomicrobium mukohataei DSM 12286]QCD66880.1 hypothetical protein E5139_14950 [Halomicrobium mukohataei]QFR21690.1 hypothetical protein GBQ70_14970 [Halomicrobium sp. ZPS1]
MLQTDGEPLTPSDRIIKTVAHTRDVPRTDLPPLYDALDPEAIDDFVTTAEEGSQLQFEYFGTSVSVSVRESGVGIDVTRTGRH